MRYGKFLLGCLFIMSLNTGTRAADSSTLMVDLMSMYEVSPNITYLKAEGVEVKLDVYAPKNPEKPVPTVVWFHWGGWYFGEKEEAVLRLLPYLDRGWAVVNAEYRLSSVALAPAAVEDARCAVWWTKRNAKKYHFDPDQIIVTGLATGGHLALMAGMAPASAGFDQRCPAGSWENYITGEKGLLPELKVAAVINWFGVTDIVDLLKGEGARPYALKWLGGNENRVELAKRISPINYVRKDLPPILSIHGTGDEALPYKHSVWLHEALDKVGAPNRLHSIDAGHADFSIEQMREAFQVIDEFLAPYIGNVNK